MTLSFSARSIRSPSPRGKRGGGLSSSLAAAAPLSAWLRFPVGAAHLPRLRSGAFYSRGVASTSLGTPCREGRALPGTHSHLPRCAADPLADGFGFPNGPQGVGSVDGEAQCVAAMGKRIRGALGSDCLSTPRRRLVAVPGQPILGGGAA